MEDIWEPIRQGFRDIREGFKESRDYDIAKQKADTDRLEKAAKIADEKEKEKAKQDFVDLIGQEGDSVFGKNTRLAQAAAAAGVNLTTFKKDKPKTKSGGYDYSFLPKNEPASTGESIDTAPAVERPKNVVGTNNPANSVRIGDKDIQNVDPDNYDYSNLESLKALKLAQTQLLNDSSIINQQAYDGLINTPEKSRGANKALQGADNLLKLTNREISVR